TSAAANNSEHFLRALTAKKDPSVRLLAVTSIVAEHYARGAPVDSVAGMIADLIEADPKIADAVVRGLAKGWPATQLPKLYARVEHDPERPLRRVSPEGRGLLINMATTWGSKKFEKYAAEVSGLLLARVKDESLGTEQRIAAVREFTGNRIADKEAVQTLLDLIAPR